MTSYFNTLDLLAGVYGIILVSFLMTVFELIFYRFIVFKDTKQAMSSLLKRMNKIFFEFGRNDAIDGDMFINNLILNTIGLNDPINIQLQNGQIATINPSDYSNLDTEQYGAFLKYIEDILFVGKSSENRNLQEINNFSFVLGAFILPILFIFLMLLNNKLRKETQKNWSQKYNTVIQVILMTSVATIILLGSFQFVFYTFGTKFQYVGAAGTDEISHTFNNQLREGFGMKTINPEII